MAASLEEQVLIDLWRHGDQEAARQIVERYVDRLLHLARGRISQRLASRYSPAHEASHATAEGIVPATPLAHNA